MYLFQKIVAKASKVVIDSILKKGTLFHAQFKPIGIQLPALLELSQGCWLQQSI